MVDHGARDRLAELLRHLVTGRITTDHFDIEGLSIAELSQDRGVCAVFFTAAALYDNVLGWPRPSVMHKLPADARRGDLCSFPTPGWYDWPDSFRAPS
jgi:hypothetical protein